MRKIESKKTKEQKQKRNQYILAGLLIFIMFGSVFGIVVDRFNSEDKNEESGLTYRGLPLTQENSLYYLTIGNYTFSFSVNPNNASEFENINMTKLIPKFVGVPVYIDTKDYFLMQEIYQNIYRYPERIQQACIDENDCPDKDFPIKTCENNIIVIKESTVNKIYEKENCIFIEGKSEDLPLLVDAFILKLLGLN